VAKSSKNRPVWLGERHEAAPRECELADRIKCARAKGAAFPLAKLYPTASMYPWK
jgi:hypothetical protein